MFRNLKQTTLTALLTLAVAMITVHAFWWAPAIMYQLTWDPLRGACNQIKPGMQQKDVVAIIHRQGEPREEAVIPDGYSFYRGGECRVLFDRETGKVLKAGWNMISAPVR
jgi:hypothetical protein